MESPYLDTTNNYIADERFDNEQRAGFRRCAVKGRAGRTELHHTRGCTVDGLKYCK